MYRKVDKLGRLVIPKEIRKRYGLNEGAVAYFTCLKEGILITKERTVKCPHCHKEVSASDNYCSICGYKVKLQLK